MKAKNKFPTGMQFQSCSALGFIKKPIHLSQNINDETTYYCAFILTTRTSKDEHTELHCYLEGDEAYAFANEFEQFDILSINFEVNHNYDWKTKTVHNRCHVLNWCSFENTIGNLPTMTDDEEKFIHKMLKLYREQAPLPSIEEVYVYKGIKNKWSKDKYKKTIGDKNE